MKTMRIAMGGILHETATFVDRRTTRVDFERGFGVYRGAEMLTRFRGTNMCPGGFMAAAEAEGFELVPLLWAFAYPSGLVVRSDFEALYEELLDALRQAEEESGPIDGVLLDLHGAMVIEGIEDGDGEVIGRVRDYFGPQRPIVVTQDMHANHTPKRVALADALIGYDTNPHADMGERGAEAGRLIARTVRGEIRPRTALRQIPLFWSAERQITALEPMLEVLRRVHELESRPGMLSVTIATGFCWADVPEIGASIIAVADGDQALAQRAADELGDWIWRHRERWHCPKTSPQEALAAGRAAGKYPIFLADYNDNTGGGAPGDSTELLHLFRELGLRDALLLYLVDPEAARVARAAGIGATVALALGGRSHERQGPPYVGEFEVVALSDGQFAYDGPMFAGLPGDMGPSAWLRADGISIVVVTSAEQPMDSAFTRSLGIDCRTMKYVAVKSSVHFRSGFGSMAGAIYNVCARALLSHDMTQLPWRRRNKPMFPLEITAEG